jgi:hypothetical protein
MLRDWVERIFVQCFVRPGVAPSVHDGPEALRQRRKLWLQVSDVTDGAVDIDPRGAGSLLDVGELGAFGDADSPVRIAQHDLFEWIGGGIHLDPGSSVDAPGRSGIKQRAEPLDR